MLAVEATREGKQSVKAEKWLYFLDPKNSRFTTVVRGAVKGWDAGKDAQVRDLFKEARVLWLKDQAQITSFASQLKSLVGVEMTVTDLQGQALIAILGAPTEGSRPFELIELDRSFPGQLRLGMLYRAKPAKAGPPEVSYHIVKADLTSYKDLTELPVQLYSIPDLLEFSKHMVTPGR